MPDIMPAVDLHESLLAAGYDIELAKEGLTHKLPRSNLVADGEFDFAWCPMRFDFALAQSVFTSLPLNFLRICLERLPNFVVPGASSSSRSSRFRMIIRPKSLTGILGHRILRRKEPYHYRFHDMEYCCRALPWRASNVGLVGTPPVGAHDGV